MTCTLNTHNTDSFADAMKDYIESDSYKKESIELNILYCNLRKRLLPEECEMLDSLFDAHEKSGESLAKEAYARGITNNKIDTI